MNKKIFLALQILRFNLIQYSKRIFLRLFKYLYISNNDAELVKKSGLFDFDYYAKVASQPHLNENELINHFLDVGWKLELSPQPLFDVRFYKKTNIDVNKSGMNPFVHYLRYGFHEGRDTHELFSINEYSKKIRWNPFIHGNPLLYYIYSLNHFDVSTKIEFDTEKYLTSFPHLEKLNTKAFYHYVSEGFKIVDYPTQLNLDPLTIEKLRAGDFSSANDNFFFNCKGAFLKRTVILVRTAQIYPIEKSTNAEEVLRIPSNDIHVNAPIILSPTKLRFAPYTTQSLERYIKMFKDIGIVGGSRLIIDRDFKLYHDEISKSPEDFYDTKLPYCIKKENENLTLQFRFSGNCSFDKGILIFCEHNNNYFHWLVEVLPKILFVELANIDPEIPFILEHNLHPNLIAALEFSMNINRPLIYVQRGNFYRFDEIYSVSDLSMMLDRYTGKLETKDVLIDDYFLPQLIERIKNKIQPIKITTKFRKVYIKRGRSKLRMLSNENIIIKFLKTLDFEILDINGLSFQEQVVLFGQIDFLISPSGAACTNMMFMPKRSRAIILCFEHENANLYFFNQLSERCMIDLQFITGERNFDIVGKYSVHDNYTIPIDLFKKIMTQYLSSISDSTIDGSKVGIPI